jgi:hypothetical protein
MIRQIEMAGEAKLLSRGQYMDNSNLEIKSEFGELVMRQNDIGDRFPANSYEIGCMGKVRIYGINFISTLN